MRKLIFGLILLNSVAIYADESCEIKIGPKEYSLQSEDGALSTSDAKKFELVYWKNNKLKKVKDAEIKIVKNIKFYTQKNTVNNGKGQSWTNKITDYAVRFNITTESTELYPSMMGRPAMKEISVSTLCTSIVSEE